MRYLLRFLKILGYVFLFVVIAGGLAVTLLTFMESGRARLAGVVSDLASTPDRPVAVSGISGIWSGELRVRQVLVSDREGAWLALRGLELDWSPLSLLGFAFDAQRLHVDRVEVARLPVAGESTQEGGSFSLPVTVSVDAINLPDIALGGRIAGEVARLSANGSLEIADQPMRIDARLALARTDGREGTLDALLAYLPDENRIDVKLNGAEASGGVLANLLSLPGEPAVAMSFDGSGPLSDWQGNGTFSMDGQVVTQLAARHQETDAGRRIEAKGEGQFQQFLPEGLRPLLAGASNIDVAATLGSSGAVAIERAQLVSQALEVTASGQYDPSGANDLSLNVETPGGPVPLRYGEGAGMVRFDLAGGQARLFGPADAAAVDASLTLPALNYGDYAAEGVVATIHSDAFNVTRQTGVLDVKLDAAAAGSANETVAALLAGAIGASSRVTVDANAIRFDNLAIRTGTVTARGDGSFTRGDGALAAQVAAEILSTALPAAVRDALDRTVRVSGNIARAADGALSVTGLDLRSGSLQVAGDASLANDQIQASLTGTAVDLSRLSAQATGAARLTVTASGPLGAPNVEITAASDEASVAGRAIRGLSLEARGTADMAAPTASVTLKGQVGDETLSGSANLSSSDTARTVDRLLLTLGQNRLEGTLALDDNLLPEGSITFNLPDIGPLAALALQDIAGSANGTIRFAGGDTPTVAIDAAVPQIVRGELTASDVSVDATVTDYLARPLVAGRIAVARAVNAGTEIRDIGIDLTRDGEWTGFDGSLNAAGVPATATGRVRMAENIDVELRNATAALRGIEARLARPTAITVRDGTVALDGMTIAAAGGEATITGRAGETLDLNIRLSSLPARLANAFAPGLDAAGTLSGTAQVSGSASDPSVRFDATLADGAIAQTRDAGFGAMRIVTDGTFAGGQLRFTANVGEGSGLGLNGGGSVNVNARSLDVNFSGRVPFGFLTRRLAEQGISLSGGADVTIRASGSFTAPQLSGTVRSSGAQFIHAPSGMAINELATDVTLGNGAATINSLTGTLSTGGSLSGSGRIGIDAGAGFPADLKLRIADGRYTDGEIVTANFSGDLAVTGPLTGSPLIAGTVNLGRTVITVPQRLPGSLARLDVQHRNAPRPVVRQEQALRPAGSAASESSSGLTLDVQVNAPQQIFVRGRGVDAELGGNIRLTGPVAAPQAVGLFTMRRGRLEILTKRLTFTSGTLGFSGSLVPYLDLAATSTATDATVTVLVRGPATDPAFTFESSPALPEDEILARLVFGRAMAGLSPLQIAQLASAAASLAGVGGSTSLLDTLRSKTGLDDIDIKTDEKTGDTSVAVGKYLNDKTYLSIERGSQPGSGKATIDLDVGRGIKLRGQASDDGETRGGIFYEREY